MAFVHQIKPQKSLDGVCMCVPNDNPMVNNRYEICVFFGSVVVIIWKKTQCHNGW